MQGHDAGRHIPVLTGRFCAMEGAPLMVVGASDCAPQLREHSPTLSRQQALRNGLRFVTFLRREPLCIEPLHVLEDLEQVVQRVRDVVDREVGQDGLVVAVDLGQSQVLPNDVPTPSS